jgi:hypothetical protein
MSYYQPQYGNPYFNPNPYVNPNPYLDPNAQQGNSNSSSGGSGNLLIGLIILGFLSYFIVTTFFKKDGKLTEWGAWSTCSKTCDTGTQNRERNYVSPEFGGADHPDKDKLKETQECSKDPCPINASMSEWAPSGSCLKNRTSSVTQECGPGEQLQRRTYNPPQFNGIDVSEEEKTTLQRWTPCKIKDCDNKDAYMTEWIQDTDDTNCYEKTSAGNTTLNPKKVTCGEGYKKDIRTFVSKTGNGKDNISNDEKTKVVQYNRIKCSLELCPAPVNAVCSNWIDSTETRCSTNNEWQKKQTRTYNPPKNGGADVVGDCSSANISQWVKNGDGICPSNGIFNSDFTVKNETQCIPVKGENRKFTSTATYQMAVGTGINSDYIRNNFSTKIDQLKALSMNSSITLKGDIENIEIKFTRTNNGIPQTYLLTKTITCDKVPYHTENVIKNYWNQSTGCTKDFTDDLLKNNLNTSVELLQYIETADGVKEKFKPYYVDTLKNTNDENLIKQCYGEDSSTGFLVIKSNRNNSKLYSGTEINNSNGISDVIVLENNGWKLIFQMDGNLVIRNNRGNQEWATETYGLSGTKLRLQRDGNLVIYNEVNAAKWASGTFGNGLVYLELRDNGYLLLKKSNENIVKVFYPTSSYISESGKWRNINNNSKNNCKTNWVFLNKDGSRKEGPFGSITKYENSYPWCATQDESQGNKDKKPASLESIHGVNDIIHIVLVNYLAERIYIEPHIFKRIIEDNNKRDNDDLSDLGCGGDEYTAVNSYKANNRFNELADSSDYMADIFRNETGTRAPYHFYTDYGAWHDNDTKHFGCTRFYNLYANDRFQSEKEALTQDGFKSFHDDNRNQRNWIRNDRGDSKYETYWRVYYRTLDDYVTYLNNNK